MVRIVQTLEAIPDPEDPAEGEPVLALESVKFLLSNLLEIDPSHIPDDHEQVEALTGLQEAALVDALCFSVPKENVDRYYDALFLPPAPELEPKVMPEPESVAEEAPEGKTRTKFGVVWKKSGRHAYLNPNMNDSPKPGELPVADPLGVWEEPKQTTVVNLDDVIDPNQEKEPVLPELLPTPHIPVIPVEPPKSEKQIKVVQPWSLNPG